MPLVRKHPEPGATKFLLQASHHRTAIEAAVQYVNAEFSRSRPEQMDDMLLSEFSSIERNWVIETIYQGAYMREYHLWEKSCREYFSSQGVEVPRNPPPNFTKYMKQLLSSPQFGLAAPEDVMAALSTMRSKVNNMKHQPGAQAEEFVSADDYATAVVAIEGFWEFLEKNEVVAC